jgi:hypothetical protein
MPFGQNKPPWFYYQGQWLFARNVPEDLIPVYPDPEDPEKECHTPLQIRWRKMILRSLLKQRLIAVVASRNGWAAARNCPYERRWGKLRKAAEEYITAETTEAAEAAETAETAEPAAEHMEVE